MYERAILHSDLNCFYASVEMMLDPSLRGKAVIPFLLNSFYTPFLYIRSFAAESISFILFNWFTSLAPGS